MNTKQLIAELGITSRTLRRWASALGWTGKTDWNGEEVNFLLSLKERLNQLPRVSLEAAIAELTGEDSGNENQQEELGDLPLDEKITQQYVGAAMVMGKQVAVNFAKVLDMSVYSELNNIYSSGKMTSLVERGLKRQFKGAKSDRDLLRLLPASVDVEMIEAELLEDDHLAQLPPGRE